MQAGDHALFTTGEMRRIDQAAMARGVPGIALMDAAGRAVAQHVARLWPRQPVLALCGPGNNGGDGFVAARYLAEAGWPVRVALLGAVGDLPADAAHHARLWRGPVEPIAPGLIPRDGIVIDALFGAGLSRPVGGAAFDTIRALAASRAHVCAVDVPSGLSGDTGQVLGMAAAADVTVTFFRKKPGHLLLPGRRLCGRLVVADIGIPVSTLDQVPAGAFENGPAQWLQDYPWRTEDSHKYRSGHALVLGGATQTGAARLAAMAAARVGAGLVTVAAPAASWAVYAAALTSIMVRPMDGPDDFGRLLADARRNALVLGPGAGAGVSGQTRELALMALATGRAVVLDADALSVFGTDPDALFQAIRGPCVLTPHDGEFARLFPCAADKLRRTRDAARQSGAVVVAKGADTVVACPDGRAVINANAPPELAVGGTGDVLAGLIGGLMAQGMAPFPAASAAVWLHGEAARAIGPGLMAEDLPAALPAVLGRLRELRAPRRADGA